jgi:hypothetical protein
MKRVLGLVVALGLGASATGCASHQVAPAIVGAVVGVAVADAAYRRPVVVQGPVVIQQRQYPTNYNRQPVYVCDYYTIPNRCSWQ